MGGGGGGENSVEKYISLKFDICLHLLQKKYLLILFYFLIYHLINFEGKFNPNLSFQHLNEIDTP